MPVVAALAVGGVWDLLQTNNVRTVIEPLRYPAYLLIILGAWKLAGAVALLIPGFSRIKEWAYAGTIVAYTSAIASRIVVGTRVGALVTSVVLLALTVAF